MPYIDSPFTLSSPSIPYKAPLFVFHFPSFPSSPMIPEIEKPRVTEIKVRMDCNGCVQRIKRALHGINGIYDLYIDFPQQKITIIGWTDPEKIVKAIKKTRKTAIICSHTEPTEKPAEPAPEGGAPPSEPVNQPAAEAPPDEPPKDQPPPPAEPPKDPPQPENPTPEAKPSPEPTEPTATQPTQSSKPKEVEEVHIIYRHPPEYGSRYGYVQSYGHGYGGHWNTYPDGPVYRHEPPQPVYVTHSYNTYRPSPHVTEYEYVRSPPQYIHYTRPERHNEDYRSGNNGNGNITSMFSDENPNACRIV